MSTLLTRIIAKEWISSFLGAFAVLFLITASADIINGFLRGKYESSLVLLDFVLKAPALMGKMMPISSLLATLFAVNKLKEKSELIAILATGYSSSRVYAVVIMTSLFVGLAQFLNLGYLEPYANKERQKVFTETPENSKSLTASTIEDDFIWIRNENYFARFSSFDLSKNKLLDFSIFFHDQEHRLTSSITSESASYESQQFWRLQKVTKIEQMETLSFPVLKQSESELVALIEKPEDFRRLLNDVSTLMFLNLARFIFRFEKSGINMGEYKILLFDKLALSILCILFALIPLSQIFSPNRRSTSFGKNVAFTICFTIFYYLVSTSTTALGNSGKVPPFLASLGIPMLFLLFIVVVFLKNRKL